MGYLLHILFALGASALAEAGFAADLAPSTLGPSWLWVLWLCVVPHLVAVGARRSFLRGRFTTAGALSGAVHASPPFLQAAAVCLFGWHGAVESWTGSELSLLAWPSPALLLVLLPFVLFEVLAIDAKTRLADQRPAARGRLRAFHLRMFLSGLLPVVFYVLFAALIGTSEELRVNIEEVELWNAAFGLVLLVAFIGSLPTLLKNTWETVPLASGPERAVLEDVAQRARFRCRDLLVWRTGNLMANAAIIGVGARNRVVLFSDSLLAQLDARELGAVFAHEIGHAHHRHVLVFVTWALAFFMGADLLISWLDPQSFWLAAGLLLLAVAIWYLGFGFLSRRAELQADLYSLELLGDPQALIAALEKVGGTLRDIASWRHFSTADRVGFLQRAVENPRVSRRLHTGLRRFARLGVVLFLAMGVLELVTLFGSLTENRVYVDLRLGRYEEAARRAGATGQPATGLDEELRELTLVGVELAGSPAGAGEAGLDAAAFERETKRALRAGDPLRALRTLELASLRDHLELRAVGSALEELLAGDREAARASLDEESATESWWPLFESIPAQ